MMKVIHSKDVKHLFPASQMLSIFSDLSNMIYKLPFCHLAILSLMYTSIKALCNFL